MKTKLSPFVYKIKGKKNYLFFDSIRKKLFQISPEGNPVELEKNLKENELVIETEGVIPLKFTVNVQNYKANAVVRQLQIRITGRCDKECQECGNIGSCFKNKKDMTKKNLKLLINQFKYIPIESIVIIGGNPLLRTDLIQIIKEKLISPEYKIYLKKEIFSKNEIKKIMNIGFIVIDSVCEDFCITEEEIEVDVFQYFYNQKFNPCWGNKIAIDINGDIKPCIWSNDILGNLKRDNIKDMIISGKFDYYWELTKEKFEVCNFCEFRCLCPDCRVITLKEAGYLTAKTSYCKYNPEKGKWED